MYNFYQYEKERINKINNENKTRSQSCYLRRHRELNDKLISNYNERVKNFVLNLARMSYKVHDYKGPIKNCREKFFEEGSKKILAHSTFRFSDFLTDRERVEKMINEKKMHGEAIDYISAKKIFEIQQKKLMERNNKKYYSFVQPKMKFNSTSDIERILDANYGKLMSSKITDKLMNKPKLKKSITSRRRQQDSYDEETGNSMDYKLKEEQEENEDKNNKKKLQMKLMKKTSNKTKNISDMLEREYNLRTNFKGANSLASKYCSNDCKLKKKLMFEKVEKIIEKCNNNDYFNRNYINKNRNYQQKNKSKMAGDISSQSVSIPKTSNLNNRAREREENFKKLSSEIQKGSLLPQVSDAFPLNTENIDLFSSNPFLYYIEASHEKQKEMEKEKIEMKNDKQHQKKMDYILNLYKERTTLPVFAGSSVEKNKNEIDLNIDDKIVINGETIPLYQICLIAKKVLETCDYTNKKINKPNVFLEDKKKHESISKYPTSKYDYIYEHLIKNDDNYNSPKKIKPKTGFRRQTKSVLK